MFNLIKKIIKKEPKSIYEKFPFILDWETGDRILVFDKNILSSLPINTYLNSVWCLCKYNCDLLSIDEDGYFYIKELYTSEIHKIKLEDKYTFIINVRLRYIQEEQYEKENKRKRLELEDIKKLEFKTYKENLDDKVLNTIKIYKEIK